MSTAWSSPICILDAAAGPLRVISCNSRCIASGPVECAAAYSSIAGSVNG